MNDLFKIDRLIELKSIPGTDYERLLMASSDKEIAVLFPSEGNDDSIVIRFFELQSGKEQFHSLHLTHNFQFFIPTDNIKEFDFDDNHIVIRFADMNNYLCVFDRKTSAVLSIIPSFDDFDQIKLLDDYIYFGKHYNVHPKKSPYKTLIGKLNWKTYSLLNFETPEFELIEFSHFSPNDWYDVNSKGYTVFSQTVDYSFNLYNDSLEIIDQKQVDDPGWVKVDKAPIHQSLKNITVARSIIDSLVQFHNSINRIQTIDFLNDSVLIVSKIVEKQNLKNNLRTFDLIQIDLNDTNRVVLKALNIPDLELDPESRINFDNYEYRIRNKPHLFQNNNLIFIDTFYTRPVLGEKKKKFDERNEKQAIQNENKLIYLVIASLRTSAIAQ